MLTRQIPHVVLAGLRCCPQCYLNGELLAPAHDVETAAIADAARDQAVLNSTCVGGLVAIHGNDHVAGLQPGFRGRPPFIDSRNDRAGDPHKPHGLRHLARHGVKLGAKPRPFQLAARNGTVDNQT